MTRVEKRKSKKYTKRPTKKKKCNSFFIFFFPFPKEGVSLVSRIYLSPNAYITPAPRSLIIEDWNVDACVQSPHAHLSASTSMLK